MQSHTKMQRTKNRLFSIYNEQLPIIKLPKNVLWIILKQVMTNHFVDVYLKALNHLKRKEFRSAYDQITIDIISWCKLNSTRYAHDQVFGNHSINSPVADVSRELSLVCWHFRHLLKSQCVWETEHNKLVFHYKEF
jgi:hypothetical protein